MPLLMLIPVFLIFLFGVNSIAFDEQILNGVGSTINFIFSWELLEPTGTFSSVQKMFNIFKIFFWICVCAVVIWTLSKKKEKKK